jgi:putative membrane protein
MTGLASMGALINALVFALLGIVVFVVSFRFLDWLTPYDLWKEIVEDHNVALGIMVGAMSLGVCLIIAAAIHG